MVLTSFQVKNKLGKTRFFQETLLIADIGMEVILDMPFLTLSNIDILFAKQELTLKSYTPAKALSTIKQI